MMKQLQMRLYLSFDWDPTSSKFLSFWTPRCSHKLYKKHFIIDWGFAFFPMEIYSPFFPLRGIYFAGFHLSPFVKTNLTNGFTFCSVHGTFVISLIVNMFCWRSIVISKHVLRTEWASSTIGLRIIIHYKSAKKLVGIYLAQKRRVILENQNQHKRSLSIKNLNLMCLHKVGRHISIVPNSNLINPTQRDGRGAFGNCQENQQLYISSRALPYCIPIDDHG